MAEVTKQTTREKLVTNIMYYSGEEFENVADAVQLAKESEDQLVDRLISILDYYYDQVDAMRQHS